jgi:hypothetical protein
MLINKFNITFPEKINDTECYKFISKIIGTEISRLSKPCYYPKLTIYYQDLQEITKFDDLMIKKFRDTVLDRYSKFAIFNDKYNVLLLMGIMYFSAKRKFEIAKLFYLFLAIKHYSNVFHKHFKLFCKDELFTMALEKVSHKHLYKTKGGVSPTITYLAEDEFRRYKPILSKPTKDIKDAELVSLIYSLRTRVSQSVKSFAEQYYKLYQTGEGIKKSEDEGEDEGENQALLISDKYSMIMCTYGQIDKAALEKAIIQSGIRKDIALTIVTQMSNPDYREKIRFIINLIGRVEKITNICVESGRGRLIRKITSGVRVDKYSVKDEISELLHSLDSGHQLRTIYEPQLIIFFCHYLTLFLKSRIC